MSRKRISAVIFDFDGVLVNSEIIALAELRDCLAEFGIQLTWDELIDTFLGSSFEDIQAYVRRDTGKVPGPEFRENWYARLFARYSRGLTVIPGAIELLDQLEARKIKYCVASGGSYRRLTFALDVTGLKSWFNDRAFSADSVARGKPEPDLFLYAAGRLGVTPRECLVIEDAVAGVRAATTARMHSLGFVGGSHLAERRAVHAQQFRAAGAMAVIDDLRKALDFIDAPAAEAGR
jgi:HAD superfamily hydrolase (TIGR01509 family)